MDNNLKSLPISIFQDVNDENTTLFIYLMNNPYGFDVPLGMCKRCRIFDNYEGKGDPY